MPRHTHTAAWDMRLRCQSYLLPPTAQLYPVTPWSTAFCSRAKQPVAREAHLVPLNNSSLMEEIQRLNSYKSPLMDELIKGRTGNCKWWQEQATLLPRCRQQLQGHARAGVESPAALKMFATVEVIDRFLFGYISSAELHTKTIRQSNLKSNQRRAATLLAMRQPLETPHARQRRNADRNKTFPDSCI